MPNCDTGPEQRILHPKQIHLTLERYNDTDTGVYCFPPFQEYVQNESSKNASCLVASPYRAWLRLL